MTHKELHYPSAIGLYEARSVPFGAVHAEQIVMLLCRVEVRALVRCKALRTSLRSTRKHGLGRGGRRRRGRVVDVVVSAAVGRHAVGTHSHSHGAV